MATSPTTRITGTLSAANYDFSGFIGANLTVNKAHLTVTANPATMLYGDAVPALTYAVTGFVNNETSSVISGAPALSTTASSTGPIGNYPIQVAVGTLSASNYDFPVHVRLGSMPGPSLLNPARTRSPVGHS